MHTYLEFFAGGGMARLGLGKRWTCLFANDIDPKKAASYRANFDGAKELVVADVAKLRSSDIPTRADLVWASFPCQDLSLAGAGAGLAGDRSGAFRPFWKLITRASREGRRPSTVVLENVCGALTSHAGRDFATIGDAMVSTGYRIGAVVLDASDFVPQSRPRLFIIGVDTELNLPRSLVGTTPNAKFHTRALRTAYTALSQEAREHWIWWRLPSPPERTSVFADLLEEQPLVPWDDLETTRSLLNMMSPINLAKVHAAQLKRRRIVGTIYRRTRWASETTKEQRVEIRFDDLAGCLRTPGGGSSRQRLLIVEGNKIRSRLLSAREAARLMGLPDTYGLPQRYNDAYHLIGDGVVVPVVRFLAENLLHPVLEENTARPKKAA